MPPDADLPGGGGEAERVTYTCPVFWCSMPAEVQHRWHMRRPDGPERVIVRCLSDHWTSLLAGELGKAAERW